MYVAQKGSINSTIQHTNQKILSTKSESTKHVHTTPTIQSALNYAVCTLLHSEYWPKHETNLKL
jgi:hypothetical protein